MAETTSFTIGAGASCPERGLRPGGPGRRGSAHPYGHPPRGRAEAPVRLRPLVPLDLVDATTGEVRLRCTLAEFEKLDPAEETRFLPGTSGYSGYDAEQVLVMPYYNIGMAEAYYGPMTVTYNAVPLDEVEVRAASTSTPPTGTSGGCRGWSSTLTAIM